MVKILHIDHPHKFFVIKSSELENKEKLMLEINQFYETRKPHLEPLFFVPLEKCCAVFINDIWHRCSIIEILKEGKILVQLVDEGYEEIVYWRQIYQLDPTLSTYKEFAIQCELADIEPCQRNNYKWTDEAIEQFKQITSNPFLQLAIQSAHQYKYRVTLHFSKKNMDLNVGALLVKNGHGVSIGPSTDSTEVKRQIRTILETSNKNDTLNKDQNESVHNTSQSENLNHTSVTVVYIVNPGEFYIKLNDLQSGVKKFHEQIQKAHEHLLDGNKEPVTNKIKEWNTNDNCMVYLSLKNYDYLICGYLINHPLDCNVRQWYRAKIITKERRDDANEKLLFTIFLRDVGVTVKSIECNKLFDIENQWDCVSNAVHRCHLGCLKPTGDQTEWSLTANDYFKKLIKTYSNLIVSLQDKRDINSNSIPVMLWGKKYETLHPLTPTIAKHINLNRKFLEAGLGHLIQSFDVEKNQFSLSDMEQQFEGEITLENWFKNFSNDARLKAIDAMVQKNSHTTSCDEKEVASNLQLIGDNVPSTEGTTTPPDAWLIFQKIEKNAFTGYVTYIDYEGIIYLHDAEHKDTLLDMRSNIMDNFATKTSSVTHYNPGQACLVMYHIDNKYYRGIVEKFNADSEYDVLFIDYGNVESCASNLLLPYAPYPDLPSFANKYKIEGIQPKKNMRNYSTRVVDTIHARIVTKVVSIRVTPSDTMKLIKNCTIYLGSLNVGQWLINEDLVDRYVEKSIQFHNNSDYATSQVEVRDNNTILNEDANPKEEKDMNDDLMYSFLNLQQEINNNTDEDIDRQNDKTNDESVHNDQNDQGSEDVLQFDSKQKREHLSTKRRIYPWIDYENLSIDANKQKTKRDFNLVCSFESDDENETNNNEKFDSALVDENDNNRDVEMQQSVITSFYESSKSLEWKNIVRLEEESVSSGFNKFIPNDSSSVNSRFDGLKHFKPFNLPTGMQTFAFTLISILTPNIIQILPILKEFEYREMELQQRINYLVKEMKSLKDFSAQTTCLARYTKDKMWYRALIRSYNPIKKQVNIIYVDYLNKETLPIDQLKVCPKDLLHWPLRTLTAYLYGIRPNPEKRKKDIKTALFETIKNQSLFAIVKDKKCASFNEEYPLNCDIMKNIVPIKIFTSNDLPETSVIYDKLVKNDFYTRV